MRGIAYILAFYFLVGSLFPQTDFSQLVRLADTYAHFEEHRAEAAATDLALSVWSENIE